MDISGIGDQIVYEPIRTSHATDPPSSEKPLTGSDLRRLATQCVKFPGYLFFIDVIGHRDDPAVAQAVADLREICSMVKWLGSYPNIEH